MIICEVENTALSDSPSMPAQMAPLFEGLWAHRQYGAKPYLFGDGGDRDLAPATCLFKVVNLTSNVVVGGVLVKDISLEHRRASLHCALFDAERSKGHALHGTVMAGAVMIMGFGIERLWTEVLPNSDGMRLAMACGFEKEGTLPEHIRTPTGRGDIIVCGGHSRMLLARNQELLDRMVWRGA